MEQERWRKIKKLFGATLEQDAGQRASFLEEACAGDVELFKEVTALLSAHEKSGGFLETPASAEAAMLFDIRSDEAMTGRLIGPYKIIGQIGKGGMGAVYLASRADDQYQRQVAIKVVKPGMDTEFIIQRFYTERQILANLDHPSIAKLLDGGSTEQGIPYLIMDYVEGIPIHDYCDAHRLTTTDRLKLFVQVCSAVHYAHQNLVVHRDLKPSNILVNTDGTPKLLDFGIAKLTSSTSSVEQTATAMHIMTPDYASPEQVRGETITTATDIYSLGVLLYRLLSGHHPYRFASFLPHEVARVILEVQPEKPSAAVSQVQENGQGETKYALTPEDISATREGTPEKLKRRLTGDLDNITLKAMQKEPGRRYASVQQFSEDIRRHLNGHTVIARPDTIRYRASKFIQRHKLGALVAAFIFLLLIGGVLAIFHQARVARMEAEKAQQINAFLQTMLHSADPDEKGRDITVVNVLDEAATRVDTELANQPEVEAAIRTTIGVTYTGLGKYEQAEKQLRKALQIRKSLYGEMHADVSISMKNLGQLLQVKGDIAGSESLLRKSLEIMRELKGDRDIQVAAILNDLAEVMLLKGNFDEAENLHRQELSIRRSLLGNEHAEVAQSLNDLGVVLGTKGDYSGAEKLHREALAISRKIRGNEHPDVASTLGTVASMLDAQKKYDEAAKFFEEALAMRRKLLGNEHPHVSWTLYNYSYCLLSKGDYEKAAALSR